MSIVGVGYGVEQSPAMDEAMLWSKLGTIEALHSNSSSDGEREAARRAAERMRARLAELRMRERDVVLVYSLPDPWKRKLFLALCRRYGLKPYREAGRRWSTVLLLAPQRFHQKTLWPEYLELAEEFEKDLADLADWVIREAINADVSDAEEDAPRGLPEPVSVTRQAAVAVAAVAAFTLAA